MEERNQKAWVFYFSNKVDGATILEMCNAGERTGRHNRQNTPSPVLGI